VQRLVGGNISNTQTHIDSYTGAWAIELQNQFFLDEGMALAVAAIMSMYTSASNYGAAIGHYEREVWDILAPTVPHVTAWEGSPGIDQVTGGRVHSYNIAGISHSHDKADVVTIFEVLEHVPPQHEDTAIRNLVHGTRHVLIVSWAPPGQPGHGHVNMKTREDAIAAIERHGAVYNAGMSEFIQSHGILIQFRRNVMCFCVDGMRQ